MNIGANLNKKDIKLEEEKAIVALEFKTPSKRRIRKTLEEDNQELYSTISVSDDLSEAVIKRHFEKIDGALLKNQEEHDKFRECQIELEDNLREASFAAEYKHGLMERQIGKKPKMLDPKFDGPSIFSPFS